jgi:hypothetical protein
MAWQLHCVSCGALGAIGERGAKSCSTSDQGYACETAGHGCAAATQLRLAFHWHTLYAKHPEHGKPHGTYGKHGRLCAASCAQTPCGNASTADVASAARGDGSKAPRRPMHAPLQPRRVPTSTRIRLQQGLGWAAHEESYVKACMLRATALPTRLPASAPGKPRACKRSSGRRTLQGTSATRVVSRS